MIGVKNKRRVQEQSRRQRLFETVIIIAVLIVLFNSQLSQMVALVDRAKLANVFTDQFHKRLAVAEALSLTGEFSDSMVQTVNYRFEHTLTPSTAVATPLLSTGFGDAQKAIVEKQITRTKVAETKPEQTDRSESSESSTPSINYFKRKRDQDRSTSGSIYVEGQNFYLSGGSFYYLVENLGNSSETDMEIMSFVLNSELRHKANSIWYSCAPTTLTSLGSSATSDYIARVENTCN